MRTGGADLPSSPFERVSGPPGDDNVSVRFGEGEGNRTPDAATTTRDNDRSTHRRLRHRHHLSASFFPCSSLYSDY